MSRSLEKTIVVELKRRNLILCTVESCTGGLIASRITDVSGASEIFWGALITYDNSAKSELCHIPQKLIQKATPVSPQIAKKMAQGGIDQIHRALKQKGIKTISSLSSLAPTRATSTRVTHTKQSAINKNFIAISTSGIAGPTGGTPEKPVGLCYVGIASPLHQQAQAQEVRGNANHTRKQLKAFFATQALELLLAELNQIQ